VVLLWLTLRGVDAARVWQELCLGDPAVLALAVGAVVASTLVRAARWGTLLRNNPPVRLRPLYTSMMIGYLANNVLPARMGELVRIYVLGRRAGVSKSTAASTIVLERLVDALLLLAIVAALGLVVPLPAVLRHGCPVALAGLASGAAFLILLAFKGEPLARLVGRLAGSVSERVGCGLHGVLERFLLGLEVLRSPRQGLGLLCLTAVIWGLDTTAVWLVMRALHVDLPWIAAPFVLGVISLSFLLPAAPGAVGTYEFFAVVALSPFEVAEASAVGLALVLHALAYLTSTSLGLASLLAEGLSWRELVTTQPEQQPEGV
jgi:uncharacterized protein (TIRG00374 family)